MVLINSISGIRGTIGGISGKSLTPIDIVKISTFYGFWIKKNFFNKENIIVIGRDSRKSGKTISKLISSTIQNIGFNVIDLGLSTTPTIKLCVFTNKYNGGIIISASHNPKNWNALKLLNNKGEFISEDGLKYILKNYKNYNNNNLLKFVITKKIGNYSKKNNYIVNHINKVINLPLVDIKSIQNSKFKIVVHGMNSIGGIAVPMLLNFLGVDVIKINCIPNGNIPINPESNENKINNLSKKILSENADLGIIVDPDVDRLSFVCENGIFFGEEYTIVAIADYILDNNIGPTVSNLSSSRALKDISNKKGVNHYYSSVGEFNVIKKMKETHAVIGGEGNGGVIYPNIHYGRDAITGIALFLTYLSKLKIPISKMKNRYPRYFMSKKNISLNNINHNSLKIIFNKITNKYRINNNLINLNDGLRIDFSNEWVHLRVSNTEPIIRIYTESNSKYSSEKLANKFIDEIISLN